MAELLDLSVSMLMQVRGGNRSLSPRACNRLEQAEREAGIATPTPASPVESGGLGPTSPPTEPASNPPRPQLRTFSDRLQWLRRDYFKLTLKAFAQRLKTGQGYIHELETGKKEHPSSEFIQRISGEFNVQKKWLTTGTGPQFEHNPKFYQFDKLDPVDVAFSNQFVGLYSALSTEFLSDAILAAVRLLPGCREDEMEHLLENVLAITGELMKRAKHPRRSGGPRFHPKEYPKIETFESAIEGERSLRQAAETDGWVGAIQNGAPYVADPNELESAVVVGVPINLLRLRVYDGKGNPIEPSTGKELSDSQRALLQLWADFWDTTRRGEQYPEPPHLNSDGTVSEEALQSYILNRRQTKPESAPAKHQVTAGSETKPPAKEVALPTPAGLAATHSQLRKP